MTTDNIQITSTPRNSDSNSQLSSYTDGSWIFHGTNVCLAQKESSFFLKSLSMDVGSNEPNAYWAPGFIDLQVNGYGGVDYSGTELTFDGVDAVLNALAQTGTTRHVPTIITNGQERICKNLEILAGYKQSTLQRSLAVLGFHVEGPFISSEDGPRGAHDPQYVRDPSWNEVKEWIAAADGNLIMVTLAPELPGAIKVIENLTAEGIIAAIGHTAATPEDISRAVAAGAKISTHLGNGSHAKLPRLNNYLWSQLAEDGLVAGIITDGFHLPTDALKSIIRAKQPHRIFMVSDVAPLAGCAPGKTTWGKMEIEIHPDGHISLAGTPFLAGAGHLLDHNIPKVVASGALTMEEAIFACTNQVLNFFSPHCYGTTHQPQNPEEYLDLVRFISSGPYESLNITHVIRGGELIYRSNTVSPGVNL